MRIKRLVLLAAIIAAFSVGIWFFVSPSLQRQADLDVQDELLESIMAAIDGHEVSDNEAIYYEETELAPAYELSPPQDIEALSERYEPNGETTTEPEVPPDRLYPLTQLTSQTALYRLAYSPLRA